MCGEHSTDGPLRHCHVGRVERALGVVGCEGIVTLTGQEAMGMTARCDTIVVI
jgi:hypothetical protein